VKPFPFSLCFLACAASLCADTKLTMGRPAPVTPLEPMQVTVPAGERVELIFPVLSGNVWLKNGLPIAGATGRSLVIESAQVSDTATYRVYYTSIQPLDSQDVILRVAPAPADYSPANGGANASFLTFTTRGIAGTGAQSLVAGFVVNDGVGNPFASQKVLVRAVGPTLAMFDIAGAVSNPKLEVHDSSGKTCATLPIDPATLSRAQLSAGAFPLKTGAGDAVQLLQLSGGAYTAQVTSGDGRMGLVLLEVYQVPE
jgi:hypothetical protein